MQTAAMKRLNLLVAALLLAFAGTASTAADPKTDKTYREGYEAGYKAALEAARKASAESGAPEAAPAATVGVGPVGTPPPAAAAPADKTAGPADWWNHSALLYPKLEDSWRQHVQLQLTGVSLTGNESGSSWRGGGKWISRYGRWTNELAATLDKRDIKQVGGLGNKRDYRMLQDSVRYDLTNKWYASGGFIWEKDDVSLIDSRTTWIAGPGYYWLDSDTFRLNTFLGLGRLSESYMQLVQDLVGIDERSSNLLYFYETFEWRFARDWGLRQGFRLMQDLDESGHYVLDPVNPRSGRYVADSWVKRYRYVAAVDLDYRLGPRSTLSLGIESRYDSNPWPDVLNKDTVKRLMLSIQF